VKEVMHRAHIALVVLLAGLLMPIAPVASATNPASVAGLPAMLVHRSAPPDALSLSARTEPRAQRWRVKVYGWSKPVRRGGQARINRCKATLYWGSLPGDKTSPAWLAGHDRCGFWRWDKWLPVGANFKVINRHGKVMKYRVYGRDIINRKSGTSDGLIKGDITLQTCRGRHMTFVYARRLGG
jgi:hypothetical protein